MIKMLIKWGITRFKVNIRSFSFWLITVLMTIVFILSRNVAGQYNEDTVVLVYTGDETSETADDCYRMLSESEPEGFTYERVYDEEDLRRRVSISEASCGVVFEGLAEEIGGAGMPGIADELFVTVYQTAGSADGYVIREMVYPVVARLKAVDELSEYVNRVSVTDLGSLLSGEAGESARYAVQQYEKYTQILDTGIYEIADINSTDTDRTDIDAANTGYSEPDALLHEERTASILRIVFFGMIVLTTVLCLYDTVHTDSSFYRAFSRGKRAAFAVVRVLTTVVMSTVISYGLFKIIG